MLVRTWLRSSVCWVSLPFTDTILTVCACETNLRKFDGYHSITAEDDLVQDFLWIDSCAKIADKVSPCVCMA